MSDIDSRDVHPDTVHPETLDTEGLSTAQFAERPAHVQQEPVQQEPFQQEQVRQETDQPLPADVPAAAPTQSPNGTTTGTTTNGAAPQTALFAEGERTTLTERWREIQFAFVDEPQKAIKDADALVAGLMQQLAQTFADARGDLENQWSRGGDVSTEDLRVSLQRYRAFFERLLSV